MVGKTIFTPTNWKLFLIQPFTNSFGWDEWESKRDQSYNQTSRILPSYPPLSRFLRQMAWLNKDLHFGFLLLFLNFLSWGLNPGRALVLSYIYCPFSFEPGLAKLLSCSDCSWTFHPFPSWTQPPRGLQSQVCTVTSGHS